jgi:hypothetical protein
VKTLENEAPGVVPPYGFCVDPAREPESQVRESAASLVAVWVVVPLFVHVTVEPTVTVSVSGEKLYSTALTLGPDGVPPPPPPPIGLELHAAASNAATTVLVMRSSLVDCFLS